MRLLTFLAAALFVSQAQALEFDAAKDKKCRDQLQKSLCYTGHVLHWSQVKGDRRAKAKALVAYQDRKCEKLPSAHLQTLLALYDSYPAEVKVAFCDIQRFFIVKGAVDYGGRTEYFFPPEKAKFAENEWGVVGFKGVPSGYVLEISEANRFKNESTSEYSTRVTQNRFGRGVERNGFSETLPNVAHETGHGTNGALATTIVHEIGHMLSRASRSTDIFFQPVSATTWSNFSWTVDDFQIATKNAVEIFEKSRAKSLVEGDVRDSIEFLRANGFVSFYGSTNPEEDFAETFMVGFYPDYRISHGGQVVYDAGAEMSSNPVLSKKRAYIEALLKKASPYDLTKHGSIGDL